jgi:hypothetical protein
MLIFLSQNEQGISALDLQKHVFPSGSSSMKSTFPWMQRHHVNYYKGEQLYETNRRETALTHPRYLRRTNNWQGHTRAKKHIYEQRGLHKNLDPVVMNR